MFSFLQSPTSPGWVYGVFLLVSWSPYLSPPYLLPWPQAFWIKGNTVHPSAFWVKTTPPTFYCSATSWIIQLPGFETACVLAFRFLFSRLKTHFLTFYWVIAFSSVFCPDSALSSSLSSSSQKPLVLPSASGQFIVHYLIFIRTLPFVQTFVFVCCPPLQ